MPPKKATASEGEAAGDSQGAKSAMQFNGKIPTDSDMKFLTAVMSSLKSKIDVDWDDVAKLTTRKFIHLKRPKTHQDTGSDFDLKCV
jgi:hypothetical protein